MNSQRDELMGRYMCSASEATAMLKMIAKIRAEHNEHRCRRLQRHLDKFEERLLLKSIFTAPMRLYAMTFEG